MPLPENGVTDLAVSIFSIVCHPTLPVRFLTLVKVHRMARIHTSLRSMCALLHGINCWCVADTDTVFKCHYLCRYYYSIDIGATLAVILNL